MDPFQPAIVDSPLARPLTDPEERRRQYREHGFFVVPGLLSAETLEKVKARVSEIVAGRTENCDEIFIQFELDREDQAEASGIEREMGLRKLMHSALHDAYFGELARSAEVLAPIWELHDGPLRLAQDTTLLKPPHGGREKPWHQDSAYFEIEPHQAILGSWIAIDEATVENGCMHMVAGAPDQAFIDHWKPASGPLSWEWQLNEEQMAGDEIIAVPMAPGDALIFSGMIKHGTPTNHSGLRRRSLQYHYILGDYTWVGPPDGRNDFPVLPTAGEAG